MPNELILDRYRVVDQAGSGGFATVYVAWDTKLQRKVAIKQLQLSELEAYRVNVPLVHQHDQSLPWNDDPTSGLDQLVFPSDPEFLGDYAPEAPIEDTEVRFEDVPQERYMSSIPGLDEARAAAFLNDSNIVATYDFQTVGTKAYIIMEYIEGMTLTEFLDRYDGRLTLDIIATIFADVSHALEAAHENQVLHLDIKPDNIMINRKGVVKVTDFGLATLSDLDGNAYTHGGTIGYMPLEQMHQESLDARCDEWALASVTYQMLNGDNPFIAPDLVSAEQAIRSAELVLPSLMWEDLDDQADDVLFYALDPDREERYDNVTDFAEEFQPLLGDVKAGRKELASIVNRQPSEEDEEPDFERSRISFEDVLSTGALSVIGRVLAGAACMAMGMLALMNVPQASSIGGIVMLCLSAVGAGLAAFRPAWGAGYAGIVWGIVLFLNQQIILGLILLLASIGWLVMAIRQPYASGGIALLHPFAAVLHIPFISPLLAGYTLSAGQAAASAAYSAVVSFVLGSITQGSLLNLNVVRLTHVGISIVDPAEVAMGIATTAGTWIMVASWILAAVLLSVLLKPGKTWLGVVASAASTVVLLAGLIVAELVDSQLTSFVPDLFQAFLVVVAGGVVITLCTVRGPGRLAEEDYPEYEDEG